VALLLNSNIGNQFVALQAADGEGAVTFLPVKVAEVRRLLFEPARRAFFHVHHHIGQGLGAVQVEQDMDVIGDVVHLDQVAFLFF